MDIILNTLFVILGISILPHFCLWAFWINPYVQHNGQKPASLLLPLAAYRDFSKAKDIARRTGYMPWFIKAFECIVIAQVVLFVGWVIACATLSWR